MKKEKKERELIEVDFEGEGLKPVALEAIESGAFIIVLKEGEKKGEKGKEGA
ncbi:MAG: hypothetical protein G01um101430_728 [Parcubacteria group bacterium Gr01-1014_30]|nr:MAG: hypothetical protein G01um101430_728 [Parcubacteria group bacterium Gr01-1014_30]